MANVKDQWTRPVKRADGTTVRERNERWGKGKRWLAGRVDPEGRERIKAFGTKGRLGGMRMRWRRIGSVGRTAIRGLGRFGLRRLLRDGWRRG
jgi:hypothetical protein